MLLRYLRELNWGRQILWCYLIWYLIAVFRYFDASPELWLTSLGLGVIIGIALYLSATAGSAEVRLDRWSIFRLFLMPFCVSSYAALVKGHGFILIFSPNPGEVLLAIILCAIFLGVVFAVKQFAPANR
jgi:hypothetical protein